MAIAPKIIITFRDAKGATATTEIKIPTGLDLANMIEFAQDMVAIIDAMTRGAIISVTIGISVDISSLSITGTPWSDADVEERGQFQFQTASGFYTTVNIPTFNEMNVLAGSDEIDLADLDVAPFIVAMTDGIELADLSTVEPTDSREDDIVALVYARERFRASGKRT